MIWKALMVTADSRKEIISFMDKGEYNKEKFMIIPYQAGKRIKYILLPKPVSKGEKILMQVCDSLIKQNHDTIVRDELSLKQKLGII